ncbi:MAG: hypothetical protein CVT65_08770 [Actinobacteria bacterium HGW-Actinobacteria-5]|jgi:hypothetical protein|nr:MAG: hypothetical protein CVT65_08770 [Actinobacteria bacterium HGW-Actinobacteria-5]
MVGWRRVLAVLGVVAAGVLLSGCHLQGSANVISPDEASVDLLVSDYNFDCVSPDNSDATVKLEPGPEVDGSDSCHITGTLPLSNLGFTDLHTGEFGEYWTFAGSFVEDRTSWVDADLEVRFPGEVVEANQGTIQGNTLRINPAKLTNDLRVVALNRPGPATWVIAAVVGAASGVVLTLAVVGLLRRARRIREAPTVLDPAAKAPENPVAAEGTPAAPQAVAQPVSEPAPVQVNHAWFATPPPVAGPPTTADPESAPAEEPPDHSIWAPPEERSSEGR